MNQAPITFTHDDWMRAGRQLGIPEAGCEALWEARQRWLAECEWRKRANQQ